jgi:O-antigen ligase
MKEIVLFFQKAKNASLEEVRFFVFCLLVFSLPFDRMYSQLLLILLLLLALIDFKLQKLKSIPKQFWIFQTVFLLTVIGLLNTTAEGMKDGLFLVEKQLAIVLLPFLIPISFSITKIRIDLVLKTFTAAVSWSVIYLLISQALNFNELGISVKQYVDSGLLFNHLFAEPLNMHANYLSMYASLSIFYILGQLLQKENHGKKGLYLQLIILLLGMALLVSRSSILVLIFVSFVLYPFFSKRQIKTKIGISIVLLSFAAGTFQFSSFLKNRFSTELVGEVTAKQSDSEPRMVRWKEGIKVIQESPAVGHGTGSEITKLKEKYWKKGLINSFHQKYNAHNQYLSILIKHGILGFILFLSAFIFYFKIGFQKKSFIYLSFLIQITFIFMVENVLDMNKGIFYFAIFNTLFGYFYLHHVNEKEHESASISHNSIV